uniref:Uncharacterized protein n=1 Tax=Opuntia streptacantha TaxID=393608 RepID=A0A7C9CJ84_OPUST
MIISQHLMGQRGKSTPLIHPCLTLRIASMQPMSSACTLSKSALVPVPIPMIGLSALLFIRVKTLEEGILGNIITAVFHVLILGRVRVGEGICANMLMEFSSVGSTLLSIEHASAKMAQLAQEEFASLLIHLKS